MRFAHTNIISNDWRSLAAFYERTFACTPVPPVRKQSGSWLERGTGVAGAALEGIHLLLPGHGEAGPTLEIYQYQTVDPLSPVAPNQRGFGHIAFEVEDVEATLAAVIRNGGRGLGNVTVREIDGVGVITFVYARDPEGNLLELQAWERD